MPEQKEPDPGVFIVEGTSLTIPAFAMRITEDGELSGDPIELHTEVDQTPIWLEIAFEHICSCKRAADELQIAVRQGDDEATGKALLAEMKAGMQAITSSCTAVDAFYANIKPRITVPPETEAAWEKNNTARYRQIAEIIRLAFPMSQRRAAYVKKGLQQNFFWRNQAVHPKSGTMPAAVHDTLNKATDRRFVLFRHFNAQAIARLSFTIVYWASQNPQKSKYPELQKYCDVLEGKLTPLAEKWDRSYGREEEESDSMLEFQHTVVYRTLGIDLPSGESDKELLVNTQAGLRVVVTRELDQYCFHSDQSLAAAYFMLTGGFSAEATSFTQRLETQVAEIRDARRAKHTSGLYLVFERQGTTDTYSPDIQQQEVEQFVISWDGFDTDDIRNESKVQFARLILALSIAAEVPIGTEKVSDSITLFRSDGKPIYPRSISGGQGTLWGSASLESLESTQQWLSAIECHPGLDRTYQLFASSIELQDRLRSFLTAWTALEIFLTKVFKQYEQHLFEELSGVGQPEVRNLYLKRIQEVMKDKYGLSDRFFVISATLDPANADADSEEFKTANRIRNLLSHGQDINESQLPVSSVRRLLCKYLQLHVQR